MPLLCISLLVLLLLPLSLSCDSKRPLEEYRDDYRLIVQTELSLANGIVTNLLQNSPCPALKQKLRNCMPNNMDFVSTLHSLACKMENLSISHTDGLVTSVLSSLRCPCSEKSTTEPSVRLKRRTPSRRRRNKQKNKEIKKLCKAEAILSAMTTCYQMLNTILTDT